MLRGVTSMTLGIGSLLIMDLCGGVPGIMLKMQRICGASFRGTHVTCVAGSSSSNCKSKQNTNDVSGKGFVSKITIFDVSVRTQIILQPRRSAHGSPD